MPQQIKPKRDKKEEKAAEEAKKAEAAKAAEVDEATKAAEEAAAAEAVQDEFQAKGFELVEWVQENRSIVLGALGAVVVAGLGFGIYSVASRGNDAEASAQWTKALEIYDAPVGPDPDPADSKPAYATDDEKAKAARTAFEGVVSQHKGTGAAAIANLYVGHSALKLKDFDGAVAAYEAYLQGAKPGDDLRFAAFDGIAAAKEEKGDVKGAIEALEKLVELGSTTDEDGALLNLARLYKKDGNDAKARERLDQLLKTYPDTALKARADEISATLTAAKPAESKPADSKPAEAGTTAP
jgi:tetratricopeptide (TPR) repeat protein